MCEGSEFLHFVCLCVQCVFWVGVDEHACLCIDGGYITVTGWLYDSYAPVCVYFFCYYIDIIRCENHLYSTKTMCKRINTKNKIVH